MAQTVPIIANVKPIKVELEAGKNYFWCQCGLSQSQPFCDGSHAGTDIKPLRFTAEKTGLRSCVSVNRPQMRHFAMEHMLLWVS